MNEKRSSFLIRLRSSILFVLLAALGFWAGGLTLFLLLAAVSLIGLFELYRALGLQGSSISAAGLMAAVLYLEGLFLDWDRGLIFTLLLGIALIFGTFVFSYPRYTVEQLALCLFGLVYVPVMLSFLYLTYQSGGLYMTLLICLAAWGSDVFAYLCGMLLGKHKLCPSLSPKKTVEGAVGAVLCTAGLGALYGFLLGSRLELLPHPAADCALILGLGSILAQIGDLTASAVKRCRGIKDYGNIMPGHGGILDRFDSVIGTAPLIYFLMVFLSHKP